MRSLTPMAAIVFMALSAAHSREFGPGTVELSGQGTFNWSSDNQTSQSQMMLSPGAAIYLNRNFNVGPVFGWQRYHTEDKSSDFGATSTYESTSSFVSFGLQLGFLADYDESVGRPLPFLDLSAGPEIMSTSFTGESGTSKTGGLISGTLGLKFRLSESFLLAVFYDYARHSLFPNENMHSLGFGFSGLI